MNVAILSFTRFHAEHKPEKGLSPIFRVKLGFVIWLLFWEGSHVVYCRYYFACLVYSGHPSMALGFADIEFCRQNDELRTSTRGGNVKRVSD